MITLRSEHEAEIRGAAEGAYPEECCGLVIGTGGAEALHVSRTVPSANVAADRRLAFEIDPEVLLRCQRELRGAPERVIAVYHSHPEGRDVPSERDLAMALDPELLWLVVAVTDGRAGEIRAYRLEEMPPRRFVPVAVSMP